MNVETGQPKSDNVMTEDHISLTWAVIQYSILFNLSQEQVVGLFNRLPVQERNFLIASFGTPHIEIFGKYANYED